MVSLAKENPSLDQYAYACSVLRALTLCVTEAFRSLKEALPPEYALFSGMRLNIQLD